MYLPYLRGCQFELLALRTFAANHPECTSIIPIIEPVERATKELNLTFNEMIANHFKFAIILNPNDGDFRHEKHNDIITEYPILANTKEDWIPAYLYHKNGEHILEHSLNYGLANLMIITPYNHGLEDNELKIFFENESIRYVVLNSDSRSDRSKLIHFGKKVVTLKEQLKPRLKNADYVNPDDEFYGDDFAYYEEEGLWGYSDYSILEKDFVQRMITPSVIAIHLTYRKREQEINVHHFVSDCKSHYFDFKEKFIDASQKIEPFFIQNNLSKTLAVDELIYRSRCQGGYSMGPGELKKLSILNHLELINNLSQ